MVLELVATDGFICFYLNSLHPRCHGSRADSISAAAFRIHADTVPLTTESPVMKRSHDTRLYGVIPDVHPYRLCS